MYAARDIEKHTMVIEYIGTIIRNEVANRKEKLYESQVWVTFVHWFFPLQMLLFCLMNAGPQVSVFYGAVNAID